MLELFPHVVLLSLMASTVGMFWTLCLMKNMIFGGLGNKIRSKLDYHYHQNDHLGYYGWYKLLKGLQCPYCVSIWILIVIHILYFHVMESGLGIGYSIFALFFGMGLTTLFNKVTSVFINQKLEL